MKRASAPAHAVELVSSTFVSSDGDGYEFQMGRWSGRLAPLFIDFAGITPGSRIVDVAERYRQALKALAPHSDMMRREILGHDVKFVDAPMRIAAAECQECFTFRQSLKRGHTYLDQKASSRLEMRCRILEAGKLNLLRAVLNTR